MYFILFEKASYELITCVQKVEYLNKLKIKYEILNE